MESVARDIRQQPFYWIDRHFLPTYGKLVGPHAIAVYNALVFRSDRAGRAFPGLADIAELTGIKSKHTIRKALDTLSKFEAIRMNQRFNGLSYDSNEYYILPMPDAEDAPKVVQEMPQVVQEMHQGSAGDALGVVQEMHQGSAGDATYLHTLNNNHFNNNQLTTSSSSMLAAAALTLLEKHDVDPQKLNGQAEDMAAWLAYAMTQPGLKKPVGYAMTRIRRNEAPTDVFREIVGIDMDWQELPHNAHQEAMYRKNPGILGLTLYEDLEEVSDGAITILDEIWENSIK